MGLFSWFRSFAKAITTVPKKKPTPAQSTPPPPRVTVGQCEACGRDVRVRDFAPGSRLTCRCGHVNVFGEKRKRDKLEALLIIFNSEFEPKTQFINSILSKMTARGRTYDRWLRPTTPQRVSILGGDLTQERLLAHALIEFRMLGRNDADVSRFEQATFEGSYGISGVVVSLWSE